MPPISGWKALRKAEFPPSFPAAPKPGERAIYPSLVKGGGAFGLGEEAIYPPLSKVLQRRVLVFVYWKGGCAEWWVGVWGCGCGYVGG